LLEHFTRLNFEVAVADTAQQARIAAARRQANNSTRAKPQWAHRNRQCMVVTYACGSQFQSTSFLTIKRTFPQKLNRLPDHLALAHHPGVRGRNPNVVRHTVKHGSLDGNFPVI
jgi:hypothetical protein